MKKKPAIRKRITSSKRTYRKKTPITKDQRGEFPLNPGGSDRISFKAEVNKFGKITVINNVSYVIIHEGTWEWVIRYDDHGGKGALHRHERLSLKDESEFPVPISTGVKSVGTKKKLLEWAIKDITKNYLIYRKKFLKRSGIDLY